MNQVLILTHQGDPHARAVEAYLQQHHIGYATIFTEDPSSTYKLSFTSDAGTFKLESGGRCFSVDQSWNIWNRRVMGLALSSNKDIAAALEEETLKTWEGLLYTHQGNIINDPRNNRSANNKPHQLCLARELSDTILIPDTLITNDPEQVLGFYEKHRGNICFKLQQGGAVVEQGGEHYGVYTNRITDQHLDSLHLITQAPHLFQEYVDKEYEIRVVGVGEEAIGIAIHSQDAEVSQVDYRRYDFSVPYQHISLPDSVTSFCLAMMKEYGLQFGAFDFIYSTDHDYVFLELNPNGQWLWLEELSGYKISARLAHHLATL